VTFADGHEIHTGIYRVEALKPTGAGDSFMAGFLASLSQGHPMRAAILRGSACASIVVARPGCARAMPDATELEGFLATHPGPSAP
jgi:5-dehydro-2-deoxygluconokinase